MITKERARLLFIEHGLEGLPTASLASSADLPGVFRDSVLFTVRAASEAEEKNLPRLVGVDRSAAAAFMNRHGTQYRYIVQPYEQLLYSAELLIDADGFYCEVLPGIWELDTAYAPDVLLSTHGESSVICPHPPDGMDLARFLAHNQQVRMAAHVGDAFLGMLRRWIGANWSRLNSLRLSIGLGPVGLKIHYGGLHGFSPQNIRTNLPAPSAFVQAGPLQLRPQAVLGFGEMPEPGTRVVQLTSSTPREAGEDLVDYGRSLRAAGVRAVIIPSGLLSHLAILLRECGLDTFTMQRAK